MPVHHPVHAEALPHGREPARGKRAGEGRVTEEADHGRRQRLRVAGGTRRPFSRSRMISGIPSARAAACIFAAWYATARLSACIRPDMLLAAFVAAAASALDKGPAGPLVIFGALAVLCAGKEYRPIVRSVLTTPHVLWLLLPAAWVFAGYVVGEEHFEGGGHPRVRGRREPGANAGR